MAVTTAAIAAVARVAALLVPQYPLATAAGVVLAVALGLRALPVGWRRGPIVGSTIVGGFVAAVAGIAAVLDGINTLRAIRHVWHTDLATWHVQVHSQQGRQVPVALLLLAIAAIVILPWPASHAVGVALVGLAALALPAAFALPWWSPMACRGLVSTVAGICAPRLGNPSVSWSKGSRATVA